MSFIPTSTNMVAVLGSVLAFTGISMLLKRRFDSNVPLLFYGFAIPFTTIAERPVHPAILYGGLAFALLLRFEFMGSGFTKFIAFIAMVGLALMIWTLLSVTVK